VPAPSESPVRPSVVARLVRAFAVDGARVLVGVNDGARVRSRPHKIHRVVRTDIVGAVACVNHGDLCFGQPDLVSARLSSLLMYSSRVSAEPPTPPY
jgi:hypothetical protein